MAAAGGSVEMERGTPKRKRSPNFTATERNLLVDLAVKYQKVIENKITDAVNNKQKEEAWKAIQV